jgi:hypothetical protein
VATDYWAPPVCNVRRDGESAGRTGCSLVGRWAEQGGSVRTAGRLGRSSGLGWLGSGPPRDLVVFPILLSP